MRIVQSLAIAAVLGTAALAAPSAQASDFGVSLNIGGDGYYESVWVPPVYRTEYYYGQPRLVIVVPGYYSRVYRPRYQSHYGHNHSYYGNNYYSGRGSYYGGGSSYYNNRSNDHRGHDHDRRDNTRGNDRGRDTNRNDRNDRRR